MRIETAISPARRWAAVMLVAGFGAACEDDGGTGPEPRPTPVASVIVTPKDSAWTGTMDVGDTVELAAKALAADGTELTGRTIAWASTDPLVVVVSPAGRVEALDTGTVEVTATVEGKVGRVTIEVAAPAPPATVAYVRVSPQAAVLTVGQTRQYEARAFNASDEELTGLDVVWSTGSLQVVSVSETGLVKAVSQGYGEVTATIDGVSATVGLTVTAPEPQPTPVHSVSVMPTHTSVFRTMHVQLHATALDANGGELHGRTITWTSENPDVATVGGDGLVLGVAKGTARIRAECEGVVGYATVEVRELPMGQIQEYALVGTDSLRVPGIDIGPTTWTDSTGTEHDARLVVRQGKLRIDVTGGRYVQSIVVETWPVYSKPWSDPYERRNVVDEGELLYEFSTGLMILRSTTTPGLELHSQLRGAGEYLIPQSLLGTPSRSWIWVIESPQARSPSPTGARPQARGASGARGR